MSKSFNLSLLMRACTVRRLLAGSSSSSDGPLPESNSPDTCSTASRHCSTVNCRRLIPPHCPPCAVHFPAKEQTEVSHLAIFDDVECVHFHFRLFVLGGFGLAVGAQVDHPDAREHARQSVVVLHRDRVKLVIVATRAGK